jgi:signal transduction histidine kinase
VGADRTRVLAAPALRAGAPVVVAVGARTVVSDVAVERAELALLLGAPVAVLLAGVGAWVLAGAALRPVERMRREAAEISDRDLDRRLGVPATRDEVAVLGTTINALLAFDRFHRAGDARSRDDDGTGLGLSIVRAITRAHGGEAVASNRPGGGAAVRIELPTAGVMPIDAHVG